MASSTNHRLLLLAGLLTGFLARVYRLGAESLWYDETVSAFLAAQHPAEIIRHTAGDIHPPGYYLMLHGWQRFTEPTVLHGLEYLLGWSSVAWGLLTVALLYPIGRKLLGRRVALLAVWLAAINPFHLWYSQEVRMYTMGAALGLFCLWAVLQWLDGDIRHPWRYLAGYLLAAALGLYTLYYFALLLVAVNVIALAGIWRKRGGGEHAGRRVLAWLATQFLVLLLFSPWLPFLWRQAVEPPVPPWRLPWQNLQEFVNTLVESFAALLVGQTPPASLSWLWALLALVAVAIFIWKPGGRQAASHVAPRPILLTYIFLPIALLYLLTATVTPLYHVRYLFTYAPPFMLILAAAVMALSDIQRWLGVASGMLVVLISLAGLQQFWTNPSYAADDHRGAVADLAANWRPGDLILVNAGWAYTALETYWPQELAGSDDALPPPIHAVQRFQELTETSGERPVVAVTGSVDGAPSLGWGNAESDFFAVSTEETNTAVERIGQQFDRVWHYRIYDTVSDPAAVIRDRLAESSVDQHERAYPGRDQLLIQLYEMEQSAGQRSAPAAEAVSFGDALRLDAAIVPAQANAGTLLYADMHWTPLPGLPQLAADLSMSLRLYDADGMLVSQADGPPTSPTGEWAVGNPIRQPLVVPIPAHAKPGEYVVELVVYRQDDGVALPPPDGDLTIHGQRRQIGRVNVQPATDEPTWFRPLARFDYIDLADANLTRPSAPAGGDLAVELVWRPRPNDYRDDYEATIELRDDAGDVVQSWTAPLGGSSYPSGTWSPGLPVQEVRHLPLAGDLPPGPYTVTIAVSRSSDGLPIAALSAWFWRHSGNLALGKLTIE